MVCAKPLQLTHLIMSRSLSLDTCAVFNTFNCRSIPMMTHLYHKPLSRVESRRSALFELCFLVFLIGCRDRDESNTAAKGLYYGIPELGTESLRVQSIATISSKLCWRLTSKSVFEKHFQLFSHSLKMNSSEELFYAETRPNLRIIVQMFGSSEERLWSQLYL